jgi:hypothetical protein
MAGAWLAACATELTGAVAVDQVVAAFGSSTGPTVSVTPQTDDACVLALEVHETPSTATTPASPLYQVAESEAPPAGALAFNAAYVLQVAAAGVAVAPAWTLGASRAWAALTVALRPAVPDSIQETTSQRASAGVATDVDSLAVAFPANVAAGDLLVVSGAYWSLYDVPLTVTDTRSTPYSVFLGPAVIVAGGIAHTFIAQGIATSSGACTATVNPGGSLATIKAAVTTFKHAHTLLPLDVDGGRATDSGNTAAITLTTVQEQSAVLGAVVTDGQPPLPIGFAELSSASDPRVTHSVGLAYQNVPGPITLTWTVPSLLRAANPNNGNQANSNKSPKKQTFAAGVTPTAVAVGALTIAKNMAGADVARATLTGALTINPAAKVFVGDVVATAGAVGDVQQGIILAGGVGATAALTAAAVTSITMAELIALTGTAMITGALSAGVVLAGACSSTAAVTGDLLTGLPVFLDGGLVAVAAVSGDLFTRPGILLVGDGTGAATVAGDLSTPLQARLAGAVLAQARVAGRLYGSLVPISDGPGRLSGRRLEPVAGAILAPVGGQSGWPPTPGADWPPVPGKVLVSVP